MSPAAAGPLTVITPNLTNPSRLRESSSPAHVASASSSSSAAPTATVSEYKPRNPLLAGKSTGKPAAMANHVQKGATASNSVGGRDVIQ